MQKAILVTGIGGLTPHSITGIIRENHPDYHIIGIDANKKALGFFMKGLLDDTMFTLVTTPPSIFRSLKYL